MTAHNRGCGDEPRREVFMASDERDVLEVLKFELNFLLQGGYGRSVRTPWKATSIFQDSLSCLNFGEPEKVHPCNECLLIDFVPEQFRNETVPCHHIPLNNGGQTVENCDPGYNRQQTEEALIAWLRATIERIEKERAAQVASGKL